ncbi:Anaerobic ribonucleoside-triphosphate reductase-activating protein, putative [Entamoeba invadens IP1]|uniref:Anaerobic ribonucleoside-triphosphate reductase-activating protein n=1 Tax=Entamoeba invadens IP1 TaxID=370355 RepID=A0A0A1TZP3_ENTIV|nr:Anaerobic ribonucleoside-triphosphate reductase-activating protein, putative [Entamoeba invadens IP1]ELP85655.1 Anaerobic ribonucleoside-triphosphate reductase-activating protein, putative [Entamoeba invadens IP1]|eukprot:XP_004185001.1 Anaerobic ribonucleoside-triphosphate reductase-activating protein, putative [Entamoeba invadens IP1]
MNGNMIRLAGEECRECIIHDSIVDGEGLRTTVFTQGCLRKCPNCHNPKTHALDGGKLYDIEDICNEIGKCGGQSGITISGGEPMLQAKECIKLAKYTKDVLHQNVWCYTGYTYDELIEKGTDDQKELLKHIDVLVDGPYIEAKRNLELLFRGSDNQRILRLKDGKVVSIDKDTNYSSFE